jgi:hypothetical protein
MVTFPAARFSMAARSVLTIVALLEMSWFSVNWNRVGKA